MKYIKQIAIIGGLTFIGEMMNHILPLPVPGSVYGMVVLFLCLCLGVIKEEQIKETADLLLLWMPLMFIDPSVGVIENIGYLSGNLVSFLIVVVVTTAAVMAVTGRITQSLLNLRKKERKSHE